MNNILEIKRSQLKGEPIAQVCSWNQKQGQDPRFPYVFVAYAFGGDIPVMIKSKYRKEEFDKLCG